MEVSVNEGDSHKARQGAPRKGGQLVGAHVETLEKTQSGDILWQLGELVAAEVEIHLEIKVISKETEETQETQEDARRS